MFHLLLDCFGFCHLRIFKPKDYLNIILPLLIITFWFIFRQLTLTYQIKLKVLTEVLKRDHDFLKKMTQPNQVKEQLAQLYRELEETGELFFSLSFLNLFLNFSIFFLRWGYQTSFRDRSNYFLHVLKQLFSWWREWRHLH